MPDLVVAGAEQLAHHVAGPQVASSVHAVSCSVVKQGWAAGPLAPVASAALRRLRFADPGASTNRIASSSPNTWLSRSTRTVFAARTWASDSDSVAAPGATAAAYAGSLSSAIR